MITVLETRYMCVDLNTEKIIDILISFVSTCVWTSSLARLSVAI